MSDGNFNRALLPSTPYASGLKAGKAMARTRAADLFRQWLQVHCPEQPAAWHLEQLESFRRLLAQSLST